MNIELEEVVVLDVSDDALELAAGGAQGGITMTRNARVCSRDCRVLMEPANYHVGLLMTLAIADR